MGQSRKRQIPNKLYFRIGEVSEIVGVKPYVLRYWETEFSDIRPTKSKSGQRLYKRRDVELLLQVRDLLYEERYTIDGAKQRLRELSRMPRNHPTAVPMEQKTPLVATEVASDAARQATPPAPVMANTPESEAVEVDVSVRRPVDEGGRKLLMKLKSDLQNMLQDLRT